MSDLPFAFREPDLTARLASVLDMEGKLPRALDALVPLGGADVVLLDAGGGLRARQLAALGARVTALERPGEDGRLASSLAHADGRIAVAQGSGPATGLPVASADVLISFWSAFRGPAAEEMAEAVRILRPGGRLLVVHDYGRDDVSRLLGADRPEYTSWSHRGGPFLGGGFKLRVIHCWWTFASIDEAAAFARSAFGAAAEPVVATLARPRLSYNVAIYHRTFGGGASGAESDATSAGEPATGRAVAAGVAAD